MAFERTVASTLQLSHRVQAKYGIHNRVRGRFITAEAVATGLCMEAEEGGLRREKAGILGLGQPVSHQKLGNHLANLQALYLCSKTNTATVLDPDLKD